MSLTPAGAKFYSERHTFAVPATCKCEQRSGILLPVDCLRLHDAGPPRLVYCVCCAYARDGSEFTGPRSCLCNDGAGRRYLHVAEDRTPRCLRCAHAESPDDFTGPRDCLCGDGVERRYLHAAKDDTPRCLRCAYAESRDDFTGPSDCLCNDGVERYLLHTAKDDTLRCVRCAYAESRADFIAPHYCIGCGETARYALSSQEQKSPPLPASASASAASTASAFASAPSTSVLVCRFCYWDEDSQTYMNKYGTAANLSRWICLMTSGFKRSLLITGNECTLDAFLTWSQLPMADELCIAAHDFFCDETCTACDRALTSSRRQVPCLRNERTRWNTFIEGNATWVFSQLN